MRLKIVFCRASASLVGADRLAGGAPALQSFCIIERNDAPVRKAEGLELRTKVLRGDAASRIEIEIEGVNFELDLLRGQKTGFYLDQKGNYGIVAGFARDRRVLDCFTNQGAFALTCARAGASDVTGVEENSENIAAAKRNAAQNDLEVRWIEQDVFQFLRAAEKSGKQYDLIVLDPPSFTKIKERLTRCIARLSGIAHARVQAFLQRWYAGDFFLLASRKRCRIFANNLRCACRCPTLRATVAPIRAGH